jgi:pimeloyl-ACP methyl ester carboxylesterase
LQGVTVNSQGSVGSFSRQAQFSNITYVNNPTNDARRAASRVVPSTPGASGATPAAGSGASSATTFSANRQNLGGSQNVLFQHGIFSDGSTWSRMTGWLNQDFIFGNEVVTTTPSTHHLDEQGQDLENLIQNSAGNNYILIGHSQGGLISRYAA